MNNARTLIRIQHGSHLYGTNTENSDTDYKSVFLPSGRDLIMQSVPKVIDNGTGVQNEKNTKDDIDDQGYPLQKFLTMVMNGDTVGTEILFAPDEAIIEMDPDWEYIRQNKHLLLNRQCRGFVGYCQRQAAKYGIKGSRMATCKDIVDNLAVMTTSGPQGGNTKLAVFSDILEEFCDEHEFSKIELIKQANGTELPHLAVLDRKVPYTCSVKQAYDIYNKVFENYGARATAAMNNEGIDWKAVSHAVRVAGQAIELLKNGHITFPRPEAALLLQIKRGELDYNVVAPLLEQLVDEVNAASEASSLPEESSRDAMDTVVLRLHLAQIVGKDA